LDEIPRGFFRDQMGCAGVDGCVVAGETHGIDAFGRAAIEGDSSSEVMKYRPRISVDSTRERQNFMVSRLKKW
jgi:hypothetical protein